ncbi:zf-Tim10_DDP domain-containing protein [Haematococcus lacustris]|uniref:Mitochondrial import inner membrane translocase subunit n=1 Tax=Haematococcus lacustris TaxID=44745 RepID=A0A699YAY8_HAELA|nr:zf-Tim10_DDP domain-containing protein [Haematococcus lacustris]
MAAPGMPEVSAEMQQFIQRESQVAQIQQMIATLTDTCWDKCILSTPGTYLSSKESSCLENCAKRSLPAKQYAGSNGRLELAADASCESIVTTLLWALHGLGVGAGGIMQCMAVQSL